MSLFSRIANVFRGDRVTREIDEELEAHVADAVAQGRDEREARTALGHALRAREQSREIRILPWLDSLRADAVFGWRQLMKRPATTLAAVASLGLAIGACTAAYRLIDALLLRNLPVAHPEQLYGLSRLAHNPNGETGTYDSFAYPDYQLMRDAVASKATLLAASYQERVDLTYRSTPDMEKAHLQYVSGAMFDAFGLRPAVGRLLTARDDVKPGAHPYAVLSRDYWMRRFGGDPAVLGKTFHLGTVDVFADTDLQTVTYQIVGVIDGPFTGTEPGQVTDVFLPVMMHPGATKDDWTWTRALALVPPGTPIEPLRAQLDAASRAFELERSTHMKTLSEKDRSRFIDQKLLVDPAPGGVSGLQATYGRSLNVLAALAVLALLIACVNVANLKTAQAASRTREMALRVSIGAGRWRLAQLALAESAWLAVLASIVGLLCAAWATPVLVAMIRPPDDPARLAMPMDWHVAGVVAALGFAAACIFGLAPALRAGTTKPAIALKGGEDPHSRRRAMRTLVGAQVAFCFVALFVAGLFVRTFDRLLHRPLGFAPERLVSMDAVASHAESPVFFDQVVDQLRTLPGVESAAASSWALMNGNAWNGYVMVNGAPAGHELSYFLRVTPRWFETMRMPILSGRDFLPGDVYPGTAIINETFARRYFADRNPIGQSISKDGSPCVVVAVVRDAPYRNMREGVLPTVFVPMHAVTKKGAESPVRTATFLARTASADPAAMESVLRGAVPQARPEIRVNDVHAVSDFMRAQTTRERLLATLAAFFGAVALLLGCVGLYGVLDYSVIERRHEIGIRMAIGAQAQDVAWQVSSEALTMLSLGALAGVGLGFAAAKYVQSLLYGVKATDMAMLGIPAAAMVAAAVLAAAPAVWRAVRIDPVKALRMD